MDMVLMVAAAALLSGSCSSAKVNMHRRLLSDIDYHRPSEVLAAPTVSRRFLMILQHPSATYELKQGDTQQLVCEALGSPAPSIHWIKNDAPVYEFVAKSNEMIDSNPSSVATVSSTLLVTGTSGHDVYTCLATTGFQSLRTTSIVFNKEGSTELPERSKLYPLVPRIVVWYKVYVDTIGNNIVLPCRAKGHPRPIITWRDSMGNVINDHPRMKVLRSGELVITSLRWTDMSEFSCQATNVYGTNSVKTFLYPASAAVGAAHWAGVRRNAVADEPYSYGVNGSVTILQEDHSQAILSSRAAG